MIPGLPPQLAHMMIHIRYMNLRLVLHRPRLLTTALRRVRGEHVQPDDQATVEKCRTFASDLVCAVRDDWLFNQLALRNTNWFLFQACMVLLLSLCSEPGHENRQSWINSIETSLRIFGKMSNFCSTIHRTREVVSAIYEASKSPISDELPNLDTGYDFSWDPENLDIFWDPTTWGDLPGINDFNFDVTDLGSIDQSSWT